MDAISSGAYHLKPSPHRNSATPTNTPGTTTATGANIPVSPKPVDFSSELRSKVGTHNAANADSSASTDATTGSSAQPPPPLPTQQTPSKGSPALAPKPLLVPPPIKAKPGVDSAASPATSRTNTPQPATPEPPKGLIDPAVPAWKKAFLDKKQHEKMSEAQMKEQQQKEEDLKWEGVPEWKRKILREKEAKEAEKNAPAMAAQKAEAERMQKLSEMPAWKRDLAEKKLGLK